MPGNKLRTELGWACPSWASTPSGDEAWAGDLGNSIQLGLKFWHRKKETAGCPVQKAENKHELSQPPGSSCRPTNKAKITSNNVALMVGTRAPSFLLQARWSEQQGGLWLLFLISIGFVALPLPSLEVPLKCHLHQKASWKPPSELFPPYSYRTLTSFMAYFKVLTVVVVMIIIMIDDDDDNNTETILPSMYSLSTKNFACISDSILTRPCGRHCWYPPSSEKEN